MKVKVRIGDTLWYYGQIFMIPVQLIIDSNPNVEIGKLNPGTEIEIPGYKKRSYFVQKGDTFGKLSATRNIPVDSLLLLNQTINPTQLTIGNEIFLPEKITSPSIIGKQEYTYEVLCSDLNKLQANYPFITVNTIGKSVEGRTIQEIKVGNGDFKVHFNASFHANEWITSGILMRLLNSYLIGLTTGRMVAGKSAFALYKRVELSIVPMVNPDGVNLVLNGPIGQEKERVLSINDFSEDFSTWKANIRGVDLNNQYPAHWEIEKKRKEPKTPAPRDYPGDAPLTEPEAIIMRDLADRSKFNRVICFHTQGEEFYWGYEGKEPSESTITAAEFSRQSGYDAIRYVDSHAGYKDWFIYEYKREGYTIELGKGENPLPLEQFDKILQDCYGLFFAGLYM